MKINKKILILISIILLIIVLMFFLSPLKRIDYNRTKKELGKINKDSISKYYDLYRVNYFFENYKKDVFLDFIKKRNLDLYKQLSNQYIKVYQARRPRHLYQTEGVYFSQNEISESDFNEDITPVYLYNHKKFKGNTLYGIIDDEIFAIAYFNTSQIIANNIHCEKGNVKYKLDTILKENSSYNFFTKSKNSKIKYTKSVDIRISSFLEKDSLIIESLEKYDMIFSRFIYQSVDSFYCDEE